MSRFHVTVAKCPDLVGGCEQVCRYPTTCGEAGECRRDDDKSEIETDPYRAWNTYARKSGLLDENGEAPDRLRAQTAFSAFAYAWNLLVREHILRRGEIQQ